MIVYFGCLGEPGHYFHATDGRVSVAGTRLGLPWAYIDGEYAPTTHAPRLGRFQSEAPQGAAALVHRAGWTILAFWDRSGDSRPRSNSAFLAPGTHDFATMVALSREAWPQVWARFTFEVVPWAIDAREGTAP